jgi:hypothetical protein
VHNGPGDYDVSFSANVSNCAYVANTGDTGATSGTAGLVRTRSGSTNTTVTVNTYRISSNGSLLPDDYSFHLGVPC